MADNTTVQTAPAPRQHHDESVRLLHGVTTDLPAAGIEVEIMRGENELPESWTETYAWISLHKDGSHCGTDCGCVTKDGLTTIRCGDSIVMGDWTWRTYDVPWVIGWRRIGSSDTEKDLREKLMKAYGERDEARADRDRAIEDFESGHDLCDADLERAKQDGRRWARFCGALAWTAAAGWGAAIALGTALALVLAGAIG